MCGQQFVFFSLCCLQWTEVKIDLHLTASIFEIHSVITSRFSPFLALYISNSYTIISVNFGEGANFVVKLLESMPTVSHSSPMKLGEWKYRCFAGICSLHKTSSSFRQVSASFLVLASNPLILEGRVNLVSSADKHVGRLTVTGLPSCLRTTSMVYTHA